MALTSIRPMGEGDLPHGLALCRAAGWNQLERDWRLFLPNAWLLEEDGFPAGSVAVMRYGAELAWVSMLLVDPRCRRRGYGTRLLLHALHECRDVRCVRLDATPDGREVYRQHGFEDEFSIWRMEVAGGGRLALEARPLAAIPPAFDRHLLEPSLRDAPELAWTLPGRAFVLGRPGFLADHLGPVVAADGASAAELVAHVLASHPDRRFFLDAPEPVDWAAALGFKPCRPLIRMRRGDCVSMPPPFAIFGPEFG
jgi:GNAT superfamily N-acetyltransferase